MQTDHTSGLISFGLSDSISTQNHPMSGYPPPFPAAGESMINFSGGGQPSSRDEFWTVQPWKDYPLLPNEHQEYPFEYPKTMGNSSFQFGLPLDSIFNQELVGRCEVQPSVLNEWIMDMNSSDDNPPCLSQRVSNELSLSLATSQPSSGVTSYSLPKRVGSEHTSCSSDNLSLSFNSYKPLSPLLSGSRFFHAMQEILAEIACYALENFDQMGYSAAAAAAAAGIDASSGFDGEGRIMAHNSFLQQRGDEAKKKHLLSLLQVVDEQYNQCLDEIHTVVSAFHAVTELDPNLHARFALPKISLMYKNLRERISTHILAMGPHPHLNQPESTREDDNSFETSFIQKQWALQQLRKRDHQLWRPQRGLPERSVSVLRAWMFQNFLHPYPKDSEKHLLALKSGLTRSQVSNWFINARVRLWKPMIEEMYAEMNRRKTRRNEEESDREAHKNHMRFDNIRFTVD